MKRSPPQVYIVMVVLLVIAPSLVVRAAPHGQKSDSRLAQMQKHEIKNLDLSRLNAIRKIENLPESGLFSNTSLFPPVVIEEKPSESTAPPLPFVFLGRFVQNGVVTVFLAIENRRLNAKLFDVLEAGNYRLKSIESDRLIFTYLPLKIDQELGVPHATSH